MGGTGNGFSRGIGRRIEIAEVGRVIAKTSDCEHGIDSLLPDFTRHSWVNGGARQCWEPRLHAIRRAWAEIEWRSVVEGLRQCALVAISPDTISDVKTRWIAYGLSAAGLPYDTDGSPSGLIYAFVGDRQAIRNAEAAWSERDAEALGELLGYPKCCRQFFREIWVNQGWRDTTWSMAVGSTSPNGQVAEIEAGDPPLANILWRWLGVRAVSHLPCRFNCEETIQIGKRLLAVAGPEHFREEVRWITEILSWPAEWSALRGIAEIG